MKAIFMDYYGTVACEMGPIAKNVVVQIYQSSSGASPDEILSYWWTTFRERLNSANGESFRTQHAVALENFHELVRHFESTADPEDLLMQMEEHWRTTALHEDVPEFLANIHLPVYFVTNSDNDYIYANMERNGIHPTGVFTSEMARYSKPRKELFLYALEQTGLAPNEVIHVGDSITSDVRCPQSVGIRAIWLNREGRPIPEGIESIGSLMELRAPIKEVP